MDNSIWSYFGFYCESGDEYYHLIKNALNNADDGDIVEICPGTYQESNLEINKNITIEGLGNSPDDVKVYARSKNPIFYTSGWRDGVTLENFLVEQERNNKDALYIDEGTNFSLKNLTISSKGYGIDINKILDSNFIGLNVNTSNIALNINESYNGLYIDNSTFISSKNDAVNINKITGNFIIKNSEFEAEKKDGIWINTCNYVDIENSYIHDTKKEGFYVKTNNQKIDMKGNLIENPGNYGVYIADTSNPGEIKNNIIKGASIRGFYLLENKKWRGYQVENNCFENGNGKNVFNRDKNAYFNKNYYDDWSGSGAYEIPDIPVYDSNPLSSCPFSSIPKPIIDYHMDECSWDNNTSTYEIKNYGSLGSNYDATAVNGANTIHNGKICRGGDFIGTYAKLNNYPHIGNQWSMSVWIKFPLTPILDQYQLSNYYYFIIASVEGTGDLGFFAKSKYGSNYKWGVYNNNGNIQKINLGNIKFGWHHVVQVVKNSKTYLYIDGNYIGKVNIFTHGDVKYTGSSTDYTDYETIGSYMDEFKLYDTALTTDQIQQIYNNENAGKNYDGTERTCLPCMAIDHYEIWHYTTNLTCQPAPLEIKACANDNCSTLYTENVTLTLNYDSKSKQISFSGGDDNTTISYTQAETITLSTSNESPTPSHPTTCHIFNSSSTSCDITFKDTGFVFKSPTNSDYIVNNILSCSSKPIEIDAVEKDNATNKCTNMSAFNGDVTLSMYGKYITPSTNPYGTKVIVDNTSVETTNSSSTPSGTPVTLHFDNGSAQFNLSYPDAGSIEVGAIYNENGLHVEGESNPFVVKPARFVFDNLSNPADNATCTNDSCWADVGVFKRAKEEFDFNVKAVCDNATVTPNYYPINQNGDNSTVNLTAFMVAPDNGTDVTNKLDNVTISASAFHGGVAHVSESFNDVGIISMNATETDYLGAGEIFGNKPYVGRFIPDHFKITAVDNGTLKDQCDTFNYTGQTTTYNITPKFVITAQNKDNQTTVNYEGVFFKLKASDVSITNPTTDDKQLGSDKTSKVSISIERAQATLQDNHNGSGTYTFGSDNITYLKDNNSKIAPFAPQFSFVIDNITDLDNVSCINCPDNITVTGTQMKYGRLKIFNNYGPGDESLILKVQAQYWDGVQWSLNGDDVCTTLNIDDFEKKNPTGNISVSDISIGSVQGVDSGEGSLTILPPGAEKYGSIDIDLYDNASFYNWLYDNNTKGEAFFGIYRGNDRVIEWKEISP
ncbi:DUF6701 domain-containing protein [Hippea maritima]|uniref:DUF6701 domain-containing protein n=1 Tax=Hippea maritima TaxID=84405 RepID=UPI00145D1D51|nr:DUF6701 domain-containing protein [Hippea maritima]